MSRLEQIRQRVRERLHETGQLLRLLPWMLRLLWTSHGGATIGVVVLTLVQALVPVAQLWITKLLMDQLVLVVGLPAEQRTGEPVEQALFYLAMEAAIILGGVILGLASGHTRNILQESLVYHLQERVLEQSARLDLAAYESPLYFDQLQRAQQQADTGPVQLLTSLMEVMQLGFTLLSIGALVVFFEPWIALLLVLTTLPSFWALIHYGWRRFMVFDRRTPAGRRAEYLSHVLTSDTFAKEVRVWGLGRYLLDQVMGLHRRFRRENLELSRGQTVASVFGEILSTLGYYGAYLVVVLGVVAGRLTIGDLALYGGAFSRMQNLFENLLTALANVYEIQLFARYLRDFLELEPEVVPPSDPRPVPRLEKGVEVQDLQFVYPGTDPVVLDGIGFEIRPGECVAVVGANGAGKTTLVKLLLRLYDPTGGAILADGVDLRDLDPDAWRRQVGVVFQDYARFQLTVQENIGMGNIDHVDDLERVRSAAGRAGIGEVVEALPEGYESLLGRQFEGGYELSLGQWQRVALARALLRDAPFLVMDEPTAAMDAQAEYELYRYLDELAKGRMTLLISHRFSTVRMANRILVIEDGKIIEEGSHDFLLSRDTRYSHLFRLQAEGYQLAPEAVTGRVAAGDGGDGDGAEPDGGGAADGEPW